MREHTESNQNAIKLREQIIGLGSHSLRKNYYPQLQQQITELEKTKAALLEIVGDLEAARLRAEESEKQFRTLFAEIADGVVVADPETKRFRKVNASFCQMLGYTEAELLQLCILDIHPKEDIPQLLKQLSEQKCSTSSILKNLPFQRKDGSIFYTDVNLTALTLENRHCVLGVCRDITERKKVEEALRKSESLLRAVFDNAPFELWARDVEGRCIMENATLVKHWGSLLSKRPEDTPISAEALAVWQSNNRRAFAGEVVQEEVDYMVGDEKQVFQNIVAPIRVGEHIIGILGLNINVTNQKRSEEFLKKAKETAEVANQAKDQFIAVLSHELRTPLMPVLATLTVIESAESLSPEMRADMDVIRRSVEMEARLIDDLLDVTKISRGKVALQHEAVDVHDCLQTALTICQNDIQAKRLEISISLQANQHHVWGDPTRLRQVFWNLLRNAVKFTPEDGRITLRSSDAGEQLRIEISDTGIGIEPELLPRIFNVFEQGQQSKTRRFGGLGLGLSIAKAMVELHNGTLTAVSEGRDKGATFIVEIPPAPVISKPLSPPAAAAAPVEKPRKILLVDDHEDTLQTMAKLLRRWGYAVTTASSVQNALEQATKEPFDLLVSDLGLPDGSGLDIMREVRNRYGMHGIALSGYGTEKDIRESRDAGFEAHLVKPVSFDLLHAALRRVVTDIASV